MEINGMQLQENPNLTETTLIKMCRSKKKRIVKKWLKNEHNYKTVPSQEVLIFADPRLGCQVIVCHPNVAARIKQAYQDQEQERRIKMGPPMIGNIMPELKRFDRWTY